jgi:hypothetical protein
LLSRKNQSLMLSGALCELCTWLHPLLILALIFACFSQWRDHQTEKIAERDEESKAKRAETVAKAERDIDKFYEEYNAKKERQIRENK